jgi:hypothetical protein
MTISLTIIPREPSIPDMKSQFHHAQLHCRIIGCAGLRVDPETAIRRTLFNMTRPCFAA